jgi:hypothetical protein
MPKIASNGAAKVFGGLRTPSLSQTTITRDMKTDLGPKIADNTMDKHLKTSGARVRSAQTGGKVIKPF